MLGGFLKQITVTIPCSSSSCVAILVAALWQILPEVDTKRFPRKNRNNLFPYFICKLDLQRKACGGQLTSTSYNIIILLYISAFDVIIVAAINTNGLTPACHLLFDNRIEIVKDYCKNRWGPPYQIASLYSKLCMHVWVYYWRSVILLHIHMYVWWGLWVFGDGSQWGCLWDVYMWCLHTNVNQLI